jgi:iron complex outermembrane receptor protein/hemoglobin/transferrin/lactoferrin receptor protein
MEVRGRRLANPLTRDRAVARVTREQMAARLVRSTPDALAATPGAYVQQSGHGQGSVYIRGRTGQQVLLLFDGLRINHSLFRQGPNQYLFTVDHHSLDVIDVVRGSASVHLGADAMAGAVMLRPRDPTIDPTRTEPLTRPGFEARYATADHDLGGRAEVDVQVGPRTGVLTGIGWRDADQLESSGSVGHLLSEDQTNVPLFEKEVPSFEANGRTQRGTGFTEITGDARLVHRLDDANQLTFATYVYRQSDAPRTDQCPPPEASLSECLVFDRQRRTQSYGRVDLTPELPGLNTLEGMFGWQRQYERRTRDSSETLGAITGGEDSVDVWSGRLVAHTQPITYRDLTLALDYGLDAGWETVSSSAYIELVRAGVHRESPRGQYIDGSTYTQAGLWAAPRLQLLETLTLRTGARLAAAAAHAPENTDAGSAEVSQQWLAGVANAGLIYRPWPALSARLNYEQGFRPPNLDDLTGRQPTGRGYQLENPDLLPERAQTFEAGLSWNTPALTLSLWASLAQIEHAMERRGADCPPNDRQCGAARAAVQLVNLSGTSEVRAIEASAQLTLSAQWWSSATFAWTQGEGDNPNEALGGRVPLSRIPPVNGRAELGWRSAHSGLYAEGAMRWALDQTALSVGDLADARIPFGGTPGHVVFDLRAGLRRDVFSTYVVLENLSDTPNRAHGSAINGPGRGIIWNVEFRP